MWWACDTWQWCGKPGPHVHGEWQVKVINSNPPMGPILWVSFLIITISIIYGAMCPIYTFKYLHVTKQFYVNTCAKGEHILYMPKGPIHPGSQHIWNSPKQNSIFLLPTRAICQLNAPDPKTTFDHQCMSPPPPAPRSQVATSSHHFVGGLCWRILSLMETQGYSRYWEYVGVLWLF